MDAKQTSEKEWKEFEKWVEKEVGYQDASIFSKGS